MQVFTLVLPATNTVDNIEVRLVVEDATGTVNITDVMLQGGAISTVWAGHPSEIQWSFN